MVGSRIVCCNKCGNELFYLKDGYKMACQVVCVACGDKKNGKKTKKKGIKATAAGNFARTKKGKRKDVHPTYSFNSATEANFARILEFLEVDWKYEERAFTFTNYKTKPHVYIMDFEITGGRRGKKDGLLHGFYEIKGYMDARSRNKLRRLKKNYPEEAAKTCVVIYNKYKKKDIEFCKKLGFRYILYDALTEKYEPQIPTWE
jgi:uncharacterized Zn finger protein (UPF0148 family)